MAWLRIEDGQRRKGEAEVRPVGGIGENGLMSCRRD